jgi:hypothetical protein
MGGVAAVEPGHLLKKGVERGSSTASQRERADRGISRVKRDAFRAAIRAPIYQLRAMPYHLQGGFLPWGIPQSFVQQSLTAPCTRGSESPEGALHLVGSRARFWAIH